MPKQSYWWYTPVVIVLLCGYAAGGAFAYGVYFLNWIPQISTAGGRFTVSMFGMGMLGATMYSSQWWAKDMDEALSDSKLLPHFFDALGYATTIVGGGVSGVVFFMVLTLTSALAFTTDGAPSVRPAAGFVVAFCGGLAQFKIQQMLVKFAIKWTKAVEVEQEEAQKKK